MDDGTGQLDTRGQLDGTGQLDSTGLLSGDALLPQLGVIEDQPLESRAEAFARVHDAMRSTLEGGDSVRARE